MNLKNIRKRNKMSQLKLAKELSVDQSTISKWENEVSLPSIQTLKKIAIIFNCSVKRLIG